MQSRGLKQEIYLLRVDNCSEIEVANHHLRGGVYIQNGTFYDVCCNLEGGHCFCGGREECWPSWTVGVLLVGVWVGGICLILCCGWILKKCDTLSCVRACCEPQPIVGNDNNATRNGTERSNISTISDNLRQPPRRIATPNAPPTSVLQERLE